MIKKLIKDRKIILELAKNDCKARFSSSILGIVWADLTAFGKYAGYLACFSNWI